MDSRSGEIVPVVVRPKVAPHYFGQVLAAASVTTSVRYHAWGARASTNANVDHCLRHNADFRQKLPPYRLHGTPVHVLVFAVSDAKPRVLSFEVLCSDVITIAIIVTTTTIPTDAIGVPVRSMDVTTVLLHYRALSPPPQLPKSAPSAAEMFHVCLHVPPPAHADTHAYHSTAPPHELATRSFRPCRPRSQQPTPMPQRKRHTPHVPLSVVKCRVLTNLSCQGSTIATALHSDKRQVRWSVHLLFSGTVAASCYEHPHL